MPHMTRLTSKGLYTVKIRNHPCTIIPSKSEIMRRGGYKCRTLEMTLKLRDQQPKKMKLEPFLTPYTKINSKWIKDLDIRPHTMKLLEENIGQTLSDIKDSNIFSDPPLIVMTVKTKINKWDLIKLKDFCTAKETLNKTKRQPTEQKKIFANESTDK
uniref:Uncharacterized protein n=2 Tax=Sus scrofa TaxID=9823 RepID=A0A8D1AIM2_PIG